MTRKELFIEVDIIIGQMRRFTDEDRKEVFRMMENSYCRHCGRKRPDERKCQCWNDE